MAPSQKLEECRKAAELSTYYLKGMKIYQFAGPIKIFLKEQKFTHGYFVKLFSHSRKCTNECWKKIVCNLKK